MKKKESDSQQPNRFKLLDAVILFIIIVIAVAFRLYKINTPLADLHSWRQADTAAVTRNYVRNGVDLLHPRYDDLSSNQTGMENPQGYRYVEFPLYNALVAEAYTYFPVVDLVQYGRLTSVFFSLFIIAILYYLSLKESSRITAIIAAGVYATFPFFVFFSRVILPETTSLSFIFISIFFLYVWSGTKRKKLGFVYLILSMVTFAVSLLLKPPAIFYGIALLAMFIKKYKIGFLKNPFFYAFFILAGIPLGLWRIYMLKYPEGIPPNTWLITSVNTYQGLQSIFFRPAFFRWIFFERLNNYILGGYLTFFLVLGAIVKQKRYILYSILLSALTYLFVFQGGNVQHEYYQTFILPAVALFVGIGTAYVLEQREHFISPFITYPLVLVLFALSLFFSFYNVRGYYDYPPELPQIANIVKTITDPTDKIVTDREGDTTLLYLMDRKGAPSIYRDPPELKKLGYKYLVTLNQPEIQKLKGENYQVVFENNTFTMFAL